MPASPDDKAPAERLLARLYIKPHTFRVEPDNAVRIVTTKGGGGLIEFNTLGFRKGGPVSVFTRL